MSASGVARRRRALTAGGRWVTLTGSLLVLAGCPERAAGPSEAMAACREVGQRCEVSPGKLGSCVVNDDCRGPNCFVCQSQH